MKVTSQEIKMEFREYGEITIPKGTRITHRTACGYDKNYNFVDVFGWVPTHEDGTKQLGLIHDMTYYGLNVPKQFVEDTRED